KERYEDINGFERYLVRNGTVVLKFFLHVSKAEQKARFLQRLSQPDKNWKFSVADARERDCWDSYQKAYEQMLEATSTPYAPWYIVPADHKWFTRVAVADIVVEGLQQLGLEFPRITGAKLRELEEARRLLR